MQLIALFNLYTDIILRSIMHKDSFYRKNMQFPIFKKTQYNKSP